MPNIFYQNKIFEIFRAKKAHLPQTIFQDKQDNYYDVRDIFSFSIRYFFVTKFLTCVTNFVTCISKFVICVIKFVTKNFLAHSEKYLAFRKNFLGKGEKRLGVRLASPILA